MYKLIRASVNATVPIRWAVAGIKPNRFTFNLNNNNNNSHAAQLRANNIIQFNGIAKTRYYLTIKYLNL